MAWFAMKFAMKFGEEIAPFGRVRDEVRDEVWEPKGADVPPTFLGHYQSGT